MTKKIILLMSLCLILGFSTAWGAEFNISPNGSDNSGNGSAGSPWYSLSYACSRVRSAGDVIRVNAGSYNDNGQCNWAPGVNIVGAGRDVVTINSTRSSWYIIADGGDGGNQVLSGITLNGNSRSLEKGVAVHKRHNVTIRDCNFQYIRNTAVELGYYIGEGYPNEPGTYYSGIKLFNCNFKSCASNNSGAACSGNSWGAVHINGLKGAELYKLNIDESGTDGQCIKGVGGWFSGIKIYDCVFTVGPWGAGNGCNIEIWNLMEDSEISNNVFNNGYVSFVNGRKRNGQYSFKFQNNTLNEGLIHEFSAQDISIAYNHFNGGKAGTYPTSWNSCGLAIRGGICVWPTHDGNNIDNMFIHNNVFTDTLNASIFLQSGTLMDNLRIYNNVFYNTKKLEWGGSHIQINGASLTHTDIKNNLFLQSSSAAVAGSGSISSSSIDHNYVYQNNGISVNGFSNSNNINAAPEISGSGTIPTPYFLPSGPNANIVDAGATVGLSYSGSAPDIGAFEYGTSGGGTTPPVVSLIPPTNLRVN